MKVLVIGGTRFIGKFIVEASQRAGHEVTLFNRGETAPNIPIEVIKGYVENITEFKADILKRKFDIAIHCISYDEQSAKDIVSIFQNTNTHVIVLSSCDCYEAFQGLNRNIDKAELPVTETSELSQMKYYWSDFKAKDARGSKYDKNLMTNILMASYKNGDLDPTIFRLPMIYGPFDPQYPGRHGAFIQRILDKKRELVLSEREQCSIYTYGYVENIAAAVVYAYGKKDLFGKIYNLGENKSRSRRRWAEIYSKIASWEFEYHILPQELLSKDRSCRNAPPQHILISSDLYRSESGFENPFSLEEGIKATFDFAAEHPDVLGEKDDYARELNLLEKYYSCIDSIYD